MKAVMYHYVREPDPAYPRFTYLHLSDFRRQLDHFEAATGLVSRRAFLGWLDGSHPKPEGYLLTFDDGLRDHVDLVLPEMARRGAWGIFYVPTGPHMTGRILDVHRIHILLGRRGGGEILYRLRKVLDGGMLTDEGVETFRRETYRRHEEDEATLLVKRTLNYFVSYEHREEVIDRLFDLDEPPPPVESFYLTPREMKAVTASGMLVGSHSVNHLVFSKLSLAEQEQEVEASFRFIDEAVGQQSVRTFCYPYGGFYSFTHETEEILSRVGCRFSFNVEPRDVADTDLATRPQALPRWDCNAFPHGKARREHTRA